MSRSGNENRVGWLLLILGLGAIAAMCSVGARQSRSTKASPKVAAKTAAKAPAKASSKLPVSGSFTFAVVGDNRGDSSGQAAPAFVQIVKAIKEVSPSLVLNTGDIINGYEGEDEAHLRRLWRGYREAIAPLKMPIYHTPGNHDVFDALSDRLWKELWGPKHYAFDYGGCRFIVLDTETEVGRVGTTQLAWLRQQLAAAGKRRVFIFLHRPLFPVDGHIGSSLDRYPDERDRLHQLFVQYRGVIKGVFLGHEHLYHLEKRDGVSYYTVAGGGAPLYVPYELGGFYHFVLVNVTHDKVSVTVMKVGGWPEPSKIIKSVAPGSVLEGWENSLFWYTWDQSVHKELSGQQVAEGKQALKVWADFSKYEYPLIYLPLYPSANFSRVDALKIDVHVPPHMASGLKITPVILNGEISHKAPTVALKPGWNTVTADLNGAWLPASVRSTTEQLQWILTANRKFSGSVIFDNLRIEKSDRQLLATPGMRQPDTTYRSDMGELRESWEGSLLWGVYNDAVVQEATSEFRSQGKQALKIRFDFSRFPRPLLYAPLHPRWDLSRVKALVMDVYAPPDVANILKVRLSITVRAERYEAPDVMLKPGWNTVTVNLDGTWLPRPAMAVAEQIEWRLLSEHRKLAGWIVFDNFRARAP